MGRGKVYETKIAHECRCEVCGETIGSERHDRLLAALQKWITKDSVEAAEQRIESCPGEVLTMTAALHQLEASTREWADEAEAAGYPFRAEDSRDRADKYRETLDAIVRIWEP
jgi:hypothetical protein